MSRQNKKIYCLGGANIDCKFTAMNAIHPGTSNPVVSHSSFGGVARNVAENLSRWTQDVHLQTAVGGDPAGQVLLSAARECGIHVERSLILEYANTAHYYAVMDQDGNLQVAYADMGIYDQIPTDLFMKNCEPWPEKSLLFLETNLPSNLISALIQAGQAHQCLICIDPVSVHKAGKLPPHLENVFLIKPNQAEMARLSGMDIACLRDCRQAGYRLLDRGVENIVISLGASGYVFMNKNQCRHVSPPRIAEIKDVNGAGDAFCAGIIYGLQQNYSIMQACEIGAAAAALTIQSYQTVAHDISASCLQTSIDRHYLNREYSHAAIF
ncbi:Pseudouridine kinase [Aquicella siphonis]|uniref:Pseudouridine kinase n=1 Tax=Aquicella siphonis TaxID=254247 RepID=A0A5E4PIM6_9COXI|nr:carbohydrate kinase family protein [Aquicella siphonis]VVC76920.1 Pseudouridine kinase [Aquicella siphonis]